jgi:hypothetical protein
LLQDGGLFLDSTVGQLLTVVAIPGVLVGDRAAFAPQLHQRLLVVALSSRPDTASPNPRVWFASNKTLRRLRAFPVHDAAA